MISLSSHIRNLRAQTVAVCALVVAAAPAAALEAHSPGETMTYAVMRNDRQIGTHTITLGRDGQTTNVESVTHVAVEIAFVTLYKFDQTETEQWSGSRLVALNSVTDDNGAVHRTVAGNRGGQIVVESDGLVKNIDAAVEPASLWNSDLLRQSVALEPQNGSLVPLSVRDCGEDVLTIGGRAQRAHHYVIKTSYARDVWYDEAGRLVKVEMTVSDGSTIRYVLS